MCILATINDPKLLPYGAYATPDSFVIHDRNYRPLVRFLAHEDQDEPCEGWGNADLPGGIDCLAREGWPAFIRVRPETAEIVGPSVRIEHDKDAAVYFYKGTPDRTKLQKLVDQFPELGAEIQRRDKAALTSEKAERDEIVDGLYNKYCLWIDDLTEIRERFEALRDESRIGWKPLPELSERLDDLNERDELYAAKHMDVARAFLDAAESDVTATKPHRLARIERLKERIAMMESCYAEWTKYEKFTRDESMAWCSIVGGMRFLSCFIDQTENNVAYFEAKLVRLYQRYVEARNDSLGLNQKPKLNLGLNLLGRKGIRK
jgi:hypothetical protein